VFGVGSAGLSGLALTVAIVPPFPFRLPSLKAARGTGCSQTLEGIWWGMRASLMSGSLATTMYRYRAPLQSDFGGYLVGHAGPTDERLLGNNGYRYL